MLSLIERYGYLIVFLGVMLEGVGIPLPGETVLIAAGALAHRGSLTLWETMAFGGLGAVMGGQVMYRQLKQSACRFQAKLDRLRGHMTACPVSARSLSTGDRP
jgi:membrane protein DedA with SNARE-associated domain